MIDHNHKMIFIHIPNTGGTSIEYALTRKNWFRRFKYCKHISWIHAKNTYGSVWDTYFKFSVIRNPWDWLVAIHNTHKVLRSKVSVCPWEDYLRKPFLGKHEQKFAIQGKIIGPEMNFILRFENLQEDFNTLCIKNNIKPFELPKLSGNSERPHYSTFYTEEQMKIVQEVHKEDIEKYNYKFETK